MKRLAVLPVVFSLAACTGAMDPSGAIVDMQGVDTDQFQTDLAECEQYADEVPVAKHAGVAAAAGAAVVGAVAVISGANTEGMARGAGVGAVYGGAAGAVGSVQEKRYVLRECLRGRGYRVLNHPPAPHPHTGSVPVTARVPIIR